MTNDIAYHIPFYKNPHKHLNNYLRMKSYMYFYIHLSNRYHMMSYILKNIQNHMMKSNHFHMMSYIQKNKPMSILRSHHLMILYK